VQHKRFYKQNVLNEKKIRCWSFLYWMNSKCVQHFNIFLQNNRPTNIKIHVALFMHCYNYAFLRFCFNDNNSITSKLKIMKVQAFSVFCLSTLRQARLLCISIFSILGKIYVKIACEKGFSISEKVFKR
jgi:uncharacterized protein YhhL (DUF1145 family)